MIQVGNKKVVLFGGSGFLARALIGRLIAHGASSILCVARNEGNLLKTQFETGVDILTGDIGDIWTAVKGMRGQDIAMNLAAFKHVGLAEISVLRCVKSNTIGMINLLSQSVIKEPEAFLFISTDKAAQPIRGVYGATKFLGECLVRETEAVNPLTAYRVVRYGNILYSTGSVLCKWKDAIAAGHAVTITDPNATRFYWTVEQAVDLIFDCLASAMDSTPHIAKMKAIRMGDLLDAVVEKYAGGGMVDVREIGLQPGENLHEIIVEGGVSSGEAERYTPEEVLGLI